MIVLHWFNGDGKKQEVFVRRTVEEVQKLVDVGCWYHVQSKLNPADILSKGFRFSNLVDSDLWFTGPSTVLLGNVPYNR